MATAAYMAGRKQYGRPQAALFSDNPGTLINGVYVPIGYEVGATVPTGTSESLINQFLILSDHNREPISLKPERIEKRERTINGRMRSYHVADKLTIDLSWSNLPSRAFSSKPLFNTSGEPSATVIGDANHDGTANESISIATSGDSFNADTQYTVDGGAGGVELLKWYENHKGPFWIFLSYDKYSNFAEDGQYGHLAQYNQVLQVYFSNFNYSVEKRGGSNFDLWNVSISLEEV